MDSTLLFLIKLAWACRYRLPLLITVGFMALDIRMQLEIHVQMRRIRRMGPPQPLRGGRYQNEPQLNERNRNNSDDSSGSWLTIDEEEEEREEALDYTENASDSAGTSQKSNMGGVAGVNSRETLPVHNNLLDVNLEN